MALYWVKVSRVYEDYVEADSEEEAIEIAEEAAREGLYTYWDGEAEEGRNGEL